VGKTSRPQSTEEGPRKKKNSPVPQTPRGMTDGKCRGTAEKRQGDGYITPKGARKSRIQKSHCSRGSSEVITPGGEANHEFGGSGKGKAKKLLVTRSMDRGSKAKGGIRPEGGKTQPLAGLCFSKKEMRKPRRKGKGSVR